MKARKSFIFFLIAVFIVLNCFPALGHAAGNDIIIVPMADSFFYTYDLSLGKSGTTLIMYFECTANQTAKILGLTSYDVQQKINGSWVTVASYLPGDYETDTISFGWQDTYAATVNCTYRVYARFYCKKYDGSSRTNGVYSVSFTI